MARNRIKYLKVTCFGRYVINYKHICCVIGSQYYLMMTNIIEEFT